MSLYSLSSCLATVESVAVGTRHARSIYHTETVLLRYAQQSSTSFTKYSHLEGGEGLATKQSSYKYISL